MVKSFVGVPGTGLKPWQLWLMVLTGTVIRLWYGYSAQPWLVAPDQLAWQSGLDEMQQTGNWSYLQLGHAPHEGGSPLIGLCSLLFSSMKSLLPALSITVLLIDTLVRWLQIRVAQQLFGSDTAIWFGCWTVFSTPLLLSWSVVNFGLHHAASVFPFVFFWLATRYQYHRFLPLLLGVCVAVAVSFAYDNIVLLLPAIWLLLQTDRRYSTLPVFLLAFGVCLLPHILIRLFADTGYPFEQDLIAGRDSIRFFHPNALLMVWISSLPASLLLAAPVFVPLWLKLVIVLLFVGAGLVFYLLHSTSKCRKTCIGFVVCFLLVYAASPFSITGYREATFTVYRHLAYIVPLLVLLMMDGFVHAGRWKNYGLIGWIALCGVGSLVYMNLKYEDGAKAYRAAGWILVQKYGEDMPKLFRLQAMVDTVYHHELATGLGWGLAAALLRHDQDSGAVSRLRLLIQQCPRRFRSDMENGVRFAFAPGITPVLPSSQLVKFNLQP